METCCLVYIDDIIIYSETEEEHIDHIENVLMLLEEVDFQINLVKSKFFCTEVEFLGMVVRAGQVTVNKEKVSKILDLKPPHTLRLLRGFLGMASYYRKYIKNYSQVAAPLIALTKTTTE